MGAQHEELLHVCAVPAVLFRAKTELHRADDLAAQLRNPDNQAVRERRERLFPVAPRRIPRQRREEADRSAVGG
jgi:hypothetical protein